MWHCRRRMKEKRERERKKEESEMRRKRKKKRKKRRKKRGLAIFKKLKVALIKKDLRFYLIIEFN
jgi:hypothetical protein